MAVSLKKKEKLTKEELKAYFPEAFKDAKLEKLKIPVSNNSYITSRLLEMQKAKKETIRRNRNSVYRTLKEHGIDASEPEDNLED